MTNTRGEYIFDELSMHNDYLVKPEKDGSIADGLSTLDLILIQRHILGLGSLNSPYKIIAADINNDKRVSSADLVTLRRIILGLSTGDGLESWAFVPANYKFDNPDQPFPFPSIINLNDLEQNSMHEDFVAIKRGDVNGDNLYNILGNSRSSKSAILEISILDNRAYVSLNKNLTLSGLQFELNINDGLIQRTISPGLLNVTNNNSNISNNSVKFSWNSTSDIRINKGDLLFSFEVQEGVTFEELNLNQNVIAAQAYDSNTEIYNLNVNIESISASTSLIGNSPNPFNDKTVITYDLDHNQVVNFEFFTLDGRKILDKSQTSLKGRNLIVIDARELSVAKNNIIIYKLNTSSETFTGKMMLFE